MFDRIVTSTNENKQQIEPILQFLKDEL